MYNLPVEYHQLEWWEKKEVRNQYVKEQGNLCFYCNLPLSGPPSNKVQKAWINKKRFPKQMFKHPVHLDHDHFTGLTRGAVHAKCNAFMWQYEGR
jgi:hypothetical protein